ncbi:hypothetical protein BDB01DRAFT_799634 [Pilobolus umbonatus]|nr:hypothetical protein BDB01DRAFT_799634 [Pilobolus umbonatus]
MADHLPWDNETPMSLSQLLKQSMRSVDTLVSNNSLLDKMSTHLNGLLRSQPSYQGVEEEDDEKNVRLLKSMFGTASKAMGSDADKHVLSVLQRQVFSFIGVTLGVKPFLEQKEENTQNESDSESDNDENKLTWTSAAKTGGERDAWTEKLEFYKRNNTDIFGPERAEHERLRQQALEDYEERNKEGDDEGEEDDESEEEVVETQMKSRGMNNGDGGFEVVSRRQKKKKNSTTTTTTTTTSYNSNNNNKSNYNQGNNYSKKPTYYRQPRRRFRPAEFRPTHLARLAPDTFCIPVFFPSEESYTIFHSALSSAKRTLYVCIFSLTDDDTADALASAYNRGVDVRIITDNEQLEGCKGSDISYLNEKHGIPFKADNSDQFMHNKFAVVDNTTVITGSFNWSIGARYKNRENVIITNIPSVVNAYNKEFERLWNFF